MIKRDTTKPIPSPVFFSWLQTLRKSLFRPEADLRFADFRPLGQARTTGLSIVALKTAKNWDKAYYDDDTLKDLGLPPDNNQKLEEEQKQEQQQKDATSLR